MDKCNLHVLPDAAFDAVLKRTMLYVGLTLTLSQPLLC